MAVKWMSVWIIKLSDNTFKLKSVDGDWVKIVPYSKDLDKILKDRLECLYKICYDVVANIVHYIKEL